MADLADKHVGSNIINFKVCVERSESPHPTTDTKGSAMAGEGRGWAEEARDNSQEETEGVAQVMIEPVLGKMKINPGSPEGKFTEPVAGQPTLQDASTQQSANNLPPEGSPTATIPSQCFFDQFNFLLSIPTRKLHLQLSVRRCYEGQVVHLGVYLASLPRFTSLYIE